MLGIAPSAKLTAMGHDLQEIIEPCTGVVRQRVTSHTVLRLYALQSWLHPLELLLRLAFAVFRLQACGSLASAAERARLRTAQVLRVEALLGEHAEHAILLQLLLILHCWRASALELQMGASMDREARRAAANNRGLARYLVSLSHVLTVTAVSELFAAWAGTVFSRAADRATMLGAASHAPAAAEHTGIHRLAVLRLAWQNWLHVNVFKRHRDSYVDVVCAREDRRLRRFCLQVWHIMLKTSAIHHRATNAWDWHAIGTQPCSEAASLFDALGSVMDHIASAGCRAFEERAVGDEVAHHGRPSLTSGAAALLIRREQLDACCGCFMHWRSLTWIGAVACAAVALARRAEDTCGREISQALRRSSAGAGGPLVDSMLRSDRLSTCQLHLKQWWAATQLEMMELKMMAVISERRADSKLQFAEAARLGQEVTAVCQQLAAADRRVLESATRCRSDALQRETCSLAGSGQSRSSRTLETTCVAEALSKLRQCLARRECLNAWHYVAQASAGRLQLCRIVVQTCSEAAWQSVEACRLRDKMAVIVEQMAVATMTLTESEQLAASRLEVSENQARENFDVDQARCREEIAVASTEQQTGHQQIGAEMSYMHEEQLASVVASRDHLGEQLARKTQELNLRNSAHNVKTSTLLAQLERVIVLACLRDLFMIWHYTIAFAGSSVNTGRRCGSVPSSSTEPACSVMFARPGHGPLAATLREARRCERLARESFDGWRLELKGKLGASGHLSPNLRWVDPREALSEGEVPAQRGADLQAPRVYQAVFLPTVLGSAQRQGFE